MFEEYIEITDSHNNSIKLDQRRVKLRENKNGLMALSYVAPVFEANDIEEFFRDFLASEELNLDIGGTGKLKVTFRGIVEGKGKPLPETLDHKIILLQCPKYLDPRDNVQFTSFSKFKMGYTTS